MRKLYILTLLLLLSSGVFAQTNFFHSATTSEQKNARSTAKITKKIKVFSLDEKAMRSYLKKAPIEFKNNGVTIPLEIPMPDGTTEIFNMVESPVLSPEIAAQNPDIKTYTGNGTTNKKAIIRLSLTSAGFNAMILNVGNDAVYFESYSTSKSNVYFNYFAKDVVIPDGVKQSSCGISQSNSQKKNPANNTKKLAATTSTGTQLRTFRLAMPADAEFVAHNGGTQASGFAAIVAYANRMKALYRNELSVDFTLVSGINMIYTDAATDPYTDGDQSAMLSENQTNCDAVLGNSGYDIGHVWGYTGGSGSGLASLGVVCNDSYKAQGTSGEGNLAQYSQVFMDQLVFHEIGHQFGMTHSYNSSIPVCTTRNAPTSVEPGAGATIMSYGFTCDGDDYFSSNQTGPILQFHTVSYEQAVDYMSGINGGTTTSTANTPPVITMPSAYTIPKSTPFALTASATDIDGDALTYCWEGTNIGTVTPDATTLADTSQPPFFRSYQPSTSPTRVFPLLDKILDGSNYAVGDKLPSVSIATTHRLTVRDNNANGGGVSNASVTITVDGNVGPFLETTNLSGVYDGLSTQTITWSVNGTNATTPNVNILLSTDGGLTFPTTLVAATPNDGTQVVTLPDVATQTARIKVEAVGNIFFDISNANFSIKHPLTISVTGTNTTTVGGSDGTATATTTTGTATFNYNDIKTFTGAPFSSTGPSATFSTIVIPALPTGAVINSATLHLTNVNALDPSYKNEVIVALSGNYTLPATQLFVANGAGIITPDPAINLPSFPTSGGTINLIFSEKQGFDDPGVDATIGGAFITLNYTKNGYTYLWSNGATTPTINSLVAGIYNVTVTDASGSTAIGSYTVTDPSNYTITASSDANGTITPTGTTTVASGANQTYTIKPNACNTIATVLIDGVNNPAAVSSGTYTFSNVTAPHTISATFSQAELVTWNGSAWSNTTGPTSTNPIAFTGNFTSTENIVGCTLTVSNNAVVIIASGHNVTLNDAITVVSGSFTLNNNANLIQTSAATNSGNIIVKRNSAPLMFLDYTLWSSPVLGQKLQAFSPATLAERFYTYNPTTDLYNMVTSPTSTNFALGKGYLIRMPNNHPTSPTTWEGTFTGIPNNGNVTLSVSNGTYNAIGNPYPSTISANSFIDANGITEALYFWRKTNDSATASYATYTKAGGTANAGGLSTIEPNGTIQIGQGFIAKSTSTSLSFTNAMRTSNNSDQFLKTKTIERNRIWLNLSKNTSPINQMMVAYMTNATDGIDPAIDGKYFNDNTIALNSLVNNEEYVIQGRGLPFQNSDVVPLTFRTDADGDYSIAIDHVDGLFATGQNIYLVDSVTGTETNLKTDAYTFTATTGTDNARFSLKYQKTLKVDTALFNDNSITIYKNNGNLYVNSGAIIINNIKVFDIQGKLIAEQTNVKANSATIKNVRTTQQVLIVQVTSEDNKVVNKKVVN